MASTIVAFDLGGREVEVMVRPMTTLQSVLRDQLGFTATKEGCRQGGCGSCTVLVDGEPMPSCLLPVEDVAGRRITTLESITPADGLAPDPAGVPRRQRLPVRLLHAGHGHASRRRSSSTTPHPSRRRDPRRRSPATSAAAPGMSRSSEAIGDAAAWRAERGHRTDERAR